MIGFAVMSCRQHSLGSEVPEAALAQSHGAQATFRDLEARWTAMPAEQRASLEPALVHFLDQYGKDGRAPLVRGYLAWVLLEQGRFSQARSVIAGLGQGPAGTARDLAQIAEAAILARLGDIEGALGLLRPLDGRIVDPIARELYGAEYVRAALAGRRWTEALGAMVDWAADAPPETVERIQRNIETTLSQIPVRPLERELISLEQAERDDRMAASRAPARAWLARSVRHRLYRVALSERDPALARRLLLNAPLALRKSLLGQELTQLVTHGTLVPRVAGKTLGLVVSAGSPLATRRSVALSAGLTRRLAVPNRGRERQKIQLLTRDEAGTEESMLTALASLASDGAVVLAAGVDQAGAAVAQRYARETSIPVLIFVSSEAEPSAGGAIVLGRDPREAEEFLTRELERRGARHVVVVGGAATPCNPEPAAHGPDIFPVASWKRTRADGLVLLGSVDCAREVVDELGAANLHPQLALGLEAGELLSKLNLNPPMIAVGAGRFPARLSGPTSTDPPSWFEALGHDAAELVEAALEGFPTQRVEDTKEVTELHRRAREALLRAEGELWTSEKPGLAGQHGLARTWTVATGPSMRAGAPGR